MIPQHNLVLTVIPMILFAESLAASKTQVRGASLLQLHRRRHSIREKNALCFSGYCPQFLDDHNLRTSPQQLHAYPPWLPLQRSRSHQYRISPSTSPHYPRCTLVKPGMPHSTYSPPSTSASPRSPLTPSSTIMLAVQEQPQAYSSADYRKTPFPASSQQTWYPA